MSDVEEVAITIPEFIHQQHEDELHDQELQYQHEMQAQQWKSCCFQLHKDSTTYFTSVSILGIVIIFCIVQLFRDANNSCVYIPILSLCLGVFIKSPSLG